VGEEMLRAALQLHVDMAPAIAVARTYTRNLR